MIKRGLIKREDKKAQLFGMPFSTIFSLFLIAIFVVVAFFALKYFLNIEKCNEQGMFIDDLKQEINNAWQSHSSSKTFKSSLPGVEYACFANLAEDATGTAKEKEIYKELKKNADYTANLFFYPQKKACIKATNIEHINMEEISNPYCFPVEDKVEIKIEKGYDDALVKVERV